jgi:hypothetical protein
MISAQRRIRFGGNSGRAAIDISAIEVLMLGEDSPEVFQQHDTGFFELGLYVEQRSTIGSDG